MRTQPSVSRCAFSPYRPWARCSGRGPYRLAGPRNGRRCRSGPVSAPRTALRVDLRGGPLGRHTKLSGLGLDWSLENSGPLNVDFINGTGRNTARDGCPRPPFTHPLDFSSVPVGGIVSLEYEMLTTAIDTVQFDSRIQAFARDPLDPEQRQLPHVRRPDSDLHRRRHPQPSSLLLLATGLFIIAATARPPEGSR